MEPLVYKTVIGLDIGQYAVIGGPGGAPLADAYIEL